MFDRVGVQAVFVGKVWRRLVLGGEYAVSQRWTYRQRGRAGTVEVDKRERVAFAEGPGREFIQGDAIVEVCASAVV